MTDVYAWVADPKEGGVHRQVPLTVATILEGTLTMLSSAMERIRLRDQQIQDFSAETLFAQRALAEANEELVKVQGELASVKTSWQKAENALEAEADEWESKSKKLRGDRLRAIRERNAVTRECEDLKARLERATARLEDFQRGAALLDSDEKKRLETRIAEMEDELRTADATISYLRGTADTRRFQADSSAQTVRLMTTKANAATKKVAEMEKKIEELIEVIDRDTAQVERTIATLREDRDARSIENVRLRGRIRALEAKRPLSRRDRKGRLAALEQENDRLRAMYESNKSSAAGVRNELSALQAEHADVQYRAREDIRGLNQQIEALKAGRVALLPEREPSSPTGNLMNDYQAIKRSLEFQKRENEALTRERSILREHVSIGDGEVRTLREKLRESNDTLANLNVCLRNIEALIVSHLDGTTPPAGDISADNHGDSRTKDLAPGDIVETKSVLVTSDTPVGVYFEGRDDAQSASIIPSDLQF